MPKQRLARVQPRLTPRGTWVPWALASTNAVTAVWMIAAGEWVDQQSRLVTVVTLGGHHVLLLWLAVSCFVLLAGLAAHTAGFTAVGRRERALLAVAGAVTAVVSAGVLALLAVLVVALLGVAVIGRVVLR